MMMRPVIVVLLLTGVTDGPPPREQPELQRAAANDNRTPAGQMERDTLVLRLSVMPAEWHILGDSHPPFNVLAFVEEGRTPTIPGPLLRVRVGTPVQVHMHNPLGDTLIIRGLSERARTEDSVPVVPGSTSVLRFVARHAGTYLYWATVRRSATTTFHRRADLTLAGGIVVDPPGPVAPDRIFVITQFADRDDAFNAAPSMDRHGTLLRQYGAINGRAWPHSERLQHASGDSIRWRIINASPEAHPMHLHGFYFRVDAHGSRALAADSIYTPAQRRMVVTETVGSRHTMSMVWTPDRPGGWLFHCHMTTHAAKFPPIDQREVLDWPAQHHGDPDQHALTGMNGLVLGITVTGDTATAEVARPARRLRLFVQSDSAPASDQRRFGYVLQHGAEPRPDSIQFPGPVLVLTRGEPTSIEVINRSPEPTTVHWHGIELDSYFDGVAGWSGVAGRTAPAVRPGTSFEVRLTPRRAGTFMYHTHFNDVRQQFGGLVGALIVLEPGERWDPTRDLVFLITDGVPRRVYINGSLTPPHVDLEVGRTYRIRLADLAVFRQALPIRFMRDSTLLSWRPIAKDGFTLPLSQATTRAAIVNLPSGETADFEFTPSRPGDLALVIGRPDAIEGRLTFRVIPRRP